MLSKTKDNIREQFVVDGTARSIYDIAIMDLSWISSFRQLFDPNLFWGMLGLDGIVQATSSGMAASMFTFHAQTKFMGMRGYRWNKHHPYIIPGLFDGCI